MDTLDHKLLLSDYFQQLAISTLLLNEAQHHNETEDHLIKNNISNIKVTMEKNRIKKNVNVG